MLSKRAQNPVVSRTGRAPRPLNGHLAAALAKVIPPRPQDPSVNWLDVADGLILALNGIVTFVDKEQYDRESTMLRFALRHIPDLALRALEDFG